MSTSPAVELRVLTRETYRPVLNLRVRPGQERLVASNAGSLAQAHFEPEAVPFGLYAGDEPVGFVMFGTEELNAGRLWVWRFMIGAEHQGRGLGRGAMRAVVEHARGVAGARELRLSHVDGVEGHPGPFYERLGFAYTGEVEDDERVMRLAL